MDNFNVTYTNINSPDFRNKIENVKKESKENLITVNKQSGQATIYILDKNVSNDLKKGIAINQIAFEDMGNNIDETKEDITKFSNELINVSYNPSSHLNILQNKVKDLKNEINNKINVLNVRYYLDSSLNKMSESVNDKNFQLIDKNAKNITSLAKQIAFGKVYVPEYHGFIELENNQSDRINMARKMIEISKISEHIRNLVNEN